MRYSPNYVFFVILATASALVVPISAQACDQDTPVNYWYQLGYEIPVTSLPANIDITVSRPPYDGVSYKAIATMSGELVITNSGDSPVTIVPNQVIYEIERFRQQTTPYAQEMVALAEALEEGDEIDPSSYELIFEDLTIAASDTLTYSTWYDVGLRMENPQSPGGVAPPPEPFTIDLMLLTDSQLVTVPITVTYSISPYYDENRVVLAAPVRDYMFITDLVVLGTVIGPGEDSTLRDVEYENQVFGQALVQVEEWLLGNGPAEIEIGYFGSPNASCAMSTVLGQKAYFLLQSPESNESGHYPLTDITDGARTVLPFAQGNYELVADALLEEKGVTATPRYWLTLPIVQSME